MNASPGWTTKEIYDTLTSIHEHVQAQGDMLKQIADAQTSMAESAKSIANSHNNIEKRYTKLEDRLQEAYDKASGKDQMPIKSHYMILGGTIFVSILIVIAATQYTLDATLTSVKIDRHTPQQENK